LRPALLVHHREQNPGQFRMNAVDEAVSGECT
jgi:hypothetical protein